MLIYRPTIIIISVSMQSLKGLFANKKKVAAAEAEAKANLTPLEKLKLRPRGDTFLTRSPSPPR